jgi:hypothetical protein
MVMSWLIPIGMTISVIQLVGAYMMSSMCMFMVISLVIEQVCGEQPFAAISLSSAKPVPRRMSPWAKLPRSGSPP